MALKRHLTAAPSFPKRGLHLSLVYFALKFGAAVCCSDNAVSLEATAATKFGKRQLKVWAGPHSGPQIAQQSEKAGRHQGGACSDLTAPGFFVAPDGSLQLLTPNWRKQEASTNQLTSPISLFCTAFFSQKKARTPTLSSPVPPARQNPRAANAPAGRWPCRRATDRRTPPDHPGRRFAPRRKN